MRPDEALRLIGYLLGGEAGSRATVKLAMAVSPGTLLRRVRAAVKPCAPTSRSSESMTSPFAGAGATGRSWLT